MTPEREDSSKKEVQETPTPPLIRRSYPEICQTSTSCENKDSNFQIESLGKAPKLTIIIVNFNTRDLLENCLSTLVRDRLNDMFKICVVDNGSTDGSSSMVLEKYSTIRLVTNEQNLGFSKANNLVLKKLETEYALLVNSDVLVSPETVEAMMNFMNVNTDVGILGPKLIRPDGSFDPGSKMGFASAENVIARKLGLAKLFPQSRSLAGYHMRFLDENETSQVEAVAGACMMIRKTVVNTTGLLDETFFLGCEDLDYCYRVTRTLGPSKEPYKVVYYPKAVAVHLGRQTRQKFPEKSILEFHKSAWRLYQKYQAENHSSFYNEAVKIGIILTSYLKIGAAITKRLCQKRKL